MPNYIAWTQDRNHNATSVWSRDTFPRDLMPIRNKGPEKNTYFSCIYIHNLDNRDAWKYVWKNGKVVKSVIKRPISWVWPYDK